MIKKLIRQRIIPATFSRIPLSLLEKYNGKKLLVGYYHMVSDDEVDHVKHLYQYKNVKQFKLDLEFLLKKFMLVALKDIVAFLARDKELPPGAFLLTFDDGFREMYDVAAPILVDKGIPATFFVNSAFIDNKRLSYDHRTSIITEHIQHVQRPEPMEKINYLLARNGRDSKNMTQAVLSLTYDQSGIIDEIAQLLDVDFHDYLSEKKPYLSSDQIRWLIKNGFTIGAHSVDHPLYSSLSLEDQLSQTLESVRFVRENFCLDYGAFAFPHSDNNVSSKFFTTMYKSGLVDVSFGTSGIKQDSFVSNIQRFSLEKPLMPAERIIALQFARRTYNLLKGNEQIIRL